MTIQVKPAQRTPSSTPTGRRRIPRWLAWAAVAVIVMNVAFLGVLAWMGGTEPVRQIGGGADGEIVTALPVRSDAILTANLDNDVSLWRDGRVVASTPIDGVVTSIAEGVDGYLVGSSSGVHVLDQELGQTDVLELTGGVRAVAQTDDGIVAAHGSGAFSDQYWITRMSLPDAGESAADAPLMQHQAEFTITAMAVIGALVVYGTADSQVVAISKDDGAVVWSGTARNPITTMLAVESSGTVLAGDDRGGLTAFAVDDGSRETAQVSSSAVTALAYDPEREGYAVGDGRGDVSILDESAQQRLVQHVADAPVRNLTTLPEGGLFIAPASGPWAVLDLRAVDTVNTRGAVVGAWIGLNVAAIVALGCAVIVRSATSRRKTSINVRRLWRGRLGYMFVLPALALIVLFFYYPSILAFYQSMTDFSLRGGSEWVGLENYRRAFFDDDYLRVGVGNMIIITAASFLKALLVPLLAAELIYWLRSHRFQYLFRTVFVMSAIVPGLVTTLLWRMVYDSRDGLLNNLLAAVGLDEWQRAWLGDPDTAIWAIVGMGFPYLHVFGLLILLGGLLNINRELYDSAAIDGAGWFQRFRYIDLVHLLPQFRILTFFAITGAIEGFAAIFILTRGGPGYATYVPALQMYYSIGRGELGYASAIGVLLFILSLALTIVILRFRRKETEDAE